MKKVTEKTESNQKRLLVPWLLAALLLLVVCCWLIGMTQNEDGRIFPVYITEVLASNTSYPNEDGRCCDYIEIYNSADYPVDLTGFHLGDISGGSRYAFPYGTILEPGEYLVVYCDSTVEDNRYAPFGISRSGGETFYLLASNNAIADSVTTIASDVNQAMVLLDTGAWGLSNVLTPGQPNDASFAGVQDIYNYTVSSVRITEISSAETGYVGELGVFCDWIELHNTASEFADISGYSISDNVGNDKYIFPEGTQIPANGYLLVYCSAEATGEYIAPFGLSQLGGESIVLKNAQGLIIEIIDTAAMGSGVQMLDSDGTWTVTADASPGFENSAEGHTAFLHSIGAETGSVKISEVMADSVALLSDRFGKFSDWVELHNTADESVNLAGWFLSDSPEDPRKWVFPELEIGPGERIVIFCSGMGLTVGDEVHTDFSLSSGGESLTLSSYLGNVVDSVTFGESNVNFSFVFEEDTHTTEYPTPGYPNGMDGYEQFCANHLPAGPLAIWEVMTSNDTYLPQQLGKCYDWVEIRNISDAAVQLSDYCLSDDPDRPGMYTLPDMALEPGKSIVIILSGDVTLSNGRFFHAPFSLNAAADQLLLYSGDFVPVDYVFLRNIPIGMSYGRVEGNGGFCYMDPTPANPNKAGYRMISREPESQYAPGVYSSDTSVEVTLDADGVVYYTTDGSEPDTGSPVYNGAILIGETLVLRAISVEEGKLPSDIYTATFVINEPHDIPVVSLVTDPDNLWGANGVYHDWDLEAKEINLPANIAYCGDDGSFSMDCEMNLHGETTVLVFDKKSFKVRFQDSYDGLLNYDVFEDGEVTLFSSLLVRTSHESTYSTQMHDAFIADFAAENCDTVVPQKYKYVALYLNGEYWGLYALREHHSEEHYASYMDVPADSVTMVRYGNVYTTSLYDFYHFCASNNLKSEENYAYAESILDMSSFVDWIILEAYMCNIDINNNMRYYYSTADGLWRCGLVDVDLGMTGSHAAFSIVKNSFHHGVMVSALMSNEEFQDLLATRLAELLAGPMSDENMIARIERMEDIIRTETILEEARWGTPVSKWERFVADMRDFCDGRALEMIESLCYELGFTESQKTSYFGDLLP